MATSVCPTLPMKLPNDQKAGSSKEFRRDWWQLRYSTAWTCSCSSSFHIFPGAREFTSTKTAHEGGDGGCSIESEKAGFGRGVFWWGRLRCLVVVIMLRFTLISFPYYSLICSVLYCPVRQIVSWAHGIFEQDYLRSYPKIKRLSTFERLKQSD